MSITRREKGAALIEFALVVPLFALLVVGISEFGFAFYRLNTLNKAVQEGVRYFADPLRARKQILDNPIDVTTANTTATIDYVKNFDPAILPVANFTANTAIYCAGPSDTGTNKICSASTQHIRVMAEFQHTFILGEVLNKLTHGIVPSSYTFQASSVMRVT